MSLTEYRLPLGNTEQSDLNGIRDIIEANSSIFSDYLLASYGGDASYSVSDGSFEIVDISDECIKISYGIQFFNGCKDMNSTDYKSDNLIYDVENGEIIFELNETAWRVEN